MHEVLAKANFDRDVAMLTPRFLACRRWAVNEAAFPRLDVLFAGVRPLRLAMDCSDWDEVPPGAVLLEASGSAMCGPMPGGIFHSGPHPARGGPFICMRGFREYHTHPQHVPDAWCNYRAQDGLNIPGLLDQVSRAWRRAYGQ